MYLQDERHNMESIATLQLSPAFVQAVVGELGMEFDSA